MPTEARRRPPFRNFIFDLDGTLVDSVEGIECSTRHAIEQRFPDREIPALREHIGPPVARMFERMFAELDAAQLKALVSAFREHYDTEGCRRSRPFPRVGETLAELAAGGSNMFVVTNKPRHATDMILRQNELRKYFVEVISPDSMTPAFGTKIAATKALQERRNLAARETAFVGDGADDAAAAAACGFTFIFANYGYGSGALDAAAEVVAAIDRFSDILTLPRDHQSV
jgi:phosphoglycolate phosphatase